MVTVTEPMQQLLDKSREWNCSLTDVSFARAMDDGDPLRAFRHQFCYPKLRGLPSSLGVCVCFLDPTSVTNCRPEYEQRTFCGALVVTLAILLRLINCRFIIINMY